jgi:hypothetical protein
MRVTYDFGVYNDRRCGKPWIAKVTKWDIGKPPEIEFGSYSGGYSRGFVEIEADKGDVIFFGQKDNRNPRKSMKVFAIVKEDGSLEVVEKHEARIAFLRKGESVDEVVWFFHTAEQMNEFFDSVEQISWFDDEMLTKVKDLLQGKDPLDAYDSVRNLKKDSFNPHSKEHLIMVALNEICRTCGVEVITVPSTKIDEKAYKYTYLNAGDMYAETVFMSHTAGNTLFVASWSDVIEAIDLDEV